MDTRPTLKMRNPLEEAAFAYYDNKRTDFINLGLGSIDGFYHHHFAVGDFDRRVLELPDDEREQAINAEMHRMETRQVDILVEALGGVAPEARILDAGSGRGGTAFLLHRAFGCRVDGVNISSYQNGFAREQAERRGCADRVRFHDRSMVSTEFPDASFDYVVTNETTMYVELNTTFAEFARILKPGGRYVLTTWCNNDAIAPRPPEAEAIDQHYHCHTHRRVAYLRALVDAGLIPYQVDDLTKAAIPYWELRSHSRLATGIEQVYLSGYLSDRVNYIRIASRKNDQAAPDEASQTS
ncbi:class I SAM-dependent methyltransferase [Saccharothrix australiensis]|uniref:Geranyl diphosphate 2-C-methyltransferase n=1 Tax=Saccharothrix australiensis TaxID=2072 RepID=A0A495VZ06_9PSEU|nr:class I SAM-dependent methyltransferase [Saccharothrix australiensis]RKT54454.1 geranyl diphosphate 2-C-methyltransferase [Saccharothrix australiensis]